MKMPSISVLFPVYNCKTSYLREAIESILEQTFEDFELIILDDGSENDVASVIEEYAKRDSRIIFVREEEHHGLVYGLNKMISMAQGKYLARMDGDDISVPFRFELQHKFLEEHPKYGFVGGNILLMDDDNLLYGSRKYPRKPSKKDFLKYQPYAHPTIMFRKSCMNMDKPYGGENNFHRGEDYRLFMHLTAEGVKGFNLQENLLCYRETRDSYNRRRLLDQLDEVSIRWKGFREIGLNPWHKLYYVIKPIIVWLVPNRIAFAIRNGV
ncbi:glycosyltransferase [Pseudobutyrivibrio sp.]|uniref:glycosyltransferase n=1 Tax=Pseudobutyrivibrio sp. TaxID=2014367 RepID=UPI001B5C7C77|nr:glycosyltransferase [Pseudobutyrivibrio sp.]MBP3261781.1 glycosyltransferase [Pseudobutyrivibrio sp.]